MGSPREKARSRPPDEPFRRGRRIRFSQEPEVASKGKKSPDTSSSWSSHWEFWPGRMVGRLARTTNAKWKSHLFACARFLSHPNSLVFSVDTQKPKWIYVSPYASFPNSTPSPSAFSLWLFLADVFARCDLPCPLADSVVKNTEGPIRRSKANQTDSYISPFACPLWLVLFSKIKCFLPFVLAPWPVLISKYQVEFIATVLLFPIFRVRAATPHLFSPSLVPFAI